MPEYINKEALLEAIRGQHPDDALHSPSWYEELVKRQPAADVRPVVRGKWVESGALTVCSNCSEVQQFPHWRFCPNCWAVMEVEE